ncbi:CAAX prenyl protease-related protein [Massilia cavernae]|uniref:CAAX prenyl protease-related protein n=2 Tax=Massilia cavernae TaxID=2320864 RepID=A0A418XRT8_9BURK|nr:CAAX prenyl protease-related protein [Massilia cavernae]
MADAGRGAADAPLLNRAAWARILPFLTYLFFLLVADLLARFGWHADDLRWLYAVKIGAVMLMLFLFRKHYTELYDASLGARAAIVALVTGAVVLVLWISLDADWMAVGSAPGFKPVTDGRIDWLMVAVRIFGAALVVPVMEELFWRSFLMRWIETPDFERLDPSQVKWKGFAITVLLFGFEHNLWLAGMVAGAAYNLLYVRHRSLWSPILAHALTNGLLGVWIVYTGSWNYW